MKLIALDGTVHERVTVGATERECIRDDGRCCGCAVAVGEDHDPGCDWERCPRCGGQAMCCDCRDEEMPRFTPAEALLTASTLALAVVHLAEEDA